MMTERTARTRLEYWRELLQEARDELHETRCRYAEARERGVGREALAAIQGEGEALTARVEEEENRIAEEVERLAREYPEKEE